jgi:hypothetical protein
MTTCNFTLPISPGTFDQNNMILPFYAKEVIEAESHPHRTGFPGCIYKQQKY